MDNRISYFNFDTVLCSLVILGKLFMVKNFNSFGILCIESALIKSFSFNVNTFVNVLIGFCISINCSHLDIFNTINVFLFARSFMLCNSLHVDI